MKVLRDTEWKPVGFDGNFSPIGGKPVFFFQHKKHGDILALNVAKYIDVVNNIVYFFDSSKKEKVCVSANKRKSVSPNSIQGLLQKCGL